MQKEQPRPSANSQGPETNGATQQMERQRQEQERQEREQKERETRDVLIGTWVFGTAGNTFTISLLESGALAFTQGNGYGVLSTQDGWQSAEVANGTIRLKLRNVEEPSVISQFKPKGRTIWLEEAIAKRANPVRSEESSAVVLEDVEDATMEFGGSVSGAMTYFTENPRDKREVRICSKKTHKWYKNSVAKSSEFKIALNKRMQQEEGESIRTGSEHESTRCNQSAAGSFPFIKWLQAPFQARRMQYEDWEQNPLTLQIERVQLDTLACHLMDKDGLNVASVHFTPMRTASVDDLWGAITKQTGKKKKWTKLMSQEGIVLTDELIRDAFTQKRVTPTAQSLVEIMDEVSSHSTEKDCWVIINGKVYNLTEYLSSGVHPTGNATIMEWAGKDASEEFNLIHPCSTLNMLPDDACYGDI